MHHNRQLNWTIYRISFSQQFSWISFDSVVINNVVNKLRFRLHGLKWESSSKHFFLAKNNEFNQIISSNGTFFENKNATMTIEIWIKIGILIEFNCDNRYMKSIYLEEWDLLNPNRNYQFQYQFQFQFEFQFEYQCQSIVKICFHHKNSWPKLLPNCIAFSSEE